MKKKMLSVLLALALLGSMLQMPVSAADAPTQPENSAVALAAENTYTAKPIASNYFYNQLNPRAQAIYNKLLTEFKGKKESYYDGTGIIDLKEIGDNLITDDDVKQYVDGNKDIFNDFCAAKDALDLDHSELWWIDSGYLTFYVTQDNKGYHVLVGPGRGDTYLLAGQEMNADEVSKMDADINETIDDMVDEAVSALNTANSDGTYSKADQYAYLVTNLHDQITTGIHYRYETECKDGGKNARYIRTIYGMQTHEGVCEAYARTLQVALSRVGIECVLIHGVQSKGTPEDHMWNAVNIPDTDENGKEIPRWYVVDATWDDPLVAKYSGERDLTFNEGLDGRETNTYLMVGQSVVGEYWRPSGYVSTGNFEFQYPTIEAASYSGTTIHGDDNGLKIQYSTGAMEDSTPAGVFTATFKGWNAEQAAKKGFYFLLKMYDYHPDGTADVMDEWYYADATMVLSGWDNDYFGDHPEGLRLYSSTCEYVEIAVTSREPEQRDTWNNEPSQNALSQNWRLGYFQGDESEIVAQSGMLYNVNSKYEAPPYVKTQFPAPNGNATAGVEYRFKVTYDDLLYHILPRDEDARNGIAAVDAFQDDYSQAKGQTVQVRYSTNQQDLHADGAVIPYQIAGELPFDADRNGVVDMTNNDYVKFRWIYASDEIDAGGQGIECPNTAYHNGGKKSCDVNQGCPIVGVEFNFRASDQWIDDVTEYNFSIEGVVGSRSSKYPNNFSVIAVVPGLCPACYRSQGIDWNLWGQPTLLDAPENLNLEEMAKSGGTDQETLKKLHDEMNTSGVNGRLMLVVEDKSPGAGNREEYEKINGALTEGKDAKQEEGDILARSVFEINLNRICPMVKLKPNAGQSLRVQVGYPAGITYESLTGGQSGIELKAYHFTRCDPANEKDHPCPNKDKDGHKWGEDIVGVDEIKLTPTPYGMVIICQAFSPFEIVAVKKDNSAAAADNTHDVIIVSDGNGTVNYTKDGKSVAAVGEDGNTTVPDKGSLTFTVTPKTGYKVDTVAFGGVSVTPTSDNTYQLTNVEQSDVLNVTFVPEEVKDEIGTTLVSKACTHPQESIETVKEEGKEEKAATCTKPGYVFGTKCGECGTTLTTGHEIPATGHDVVVDSDEQAPTCTTPGKRAVTHCKTENCNAKLSKGEEIPAMGHAFDDYEEYGDATCKGQPMKATCERAGCNETDIRIDVSKAVQHQFTIKVEESSTKATCTENAKDTMKCELCGETTTVEKEGTATGHFWESDGYCKNCGEYRCQSGHNNVKDLPAQAATCTEAGKTAGKQCLDCGMVFEPQEPIPATGHNYGNGHKCVVCGHEQTTKEHTPVPIPAVPATCTSTGLSEGEKCSVCGEILKQQQVTEKLAHKYGEVTWRWSEVDGVSATAEATCSVGSHTDVFPAETAYTVSKAPTCTEDGEGTYTATVKIGGQTYTDTNDGKKLPVPATGHKWGETPTSTTEATCTQYGTKTYTCTVCSETKVEDDTEGGLKEHNFVREHTKDVPATCTEAGALVSVCSVCGKVLESPVPATGHNYGNDHRCVVCGHEQVTKDHTPVPIPAVPATCNSTGLTEGEKCSVCGEILTPQTITPMTDHQYGESTINWVWTETEVGFSATAVASCVVCSHTETFPAKMTDSVSKTPTCTEDGARTYTATVQINGQSYSDTNGGKTTIIPATGHTFNNGACTVCGVKDPNGEDLTDPKVNGVAELLDTDSGKAYINGYPDDTFRPQANITRAQTAKLFYNLLRNQDISTDQTFTDVGDAWYAKEVKALAATGILTGYTDGTFRPDKAITRAEFAVICVRFTKGVSADVSFSDTKGIWAESSIAAANACGWINGYNDGSFRPNQPITRAEAVKILNKMLARTVDQKAIDEATDLNVFTDLTPDSHWAYYEIMSGANDLIP